MAEIYLDPRSTHDLKPRFEDDVPAHVSATTHHVNPAHDSTCGSCPNWAGHEGGVWDGRVHGHKGFAAICMRQRPAGTLGPSGVLHRWKEATDTCEHATPHSQPARQVRINGRVKV